MVSMETELPLEVLLTHTQEELARATAALRTADAPLVFKGRHWQLTAAAYRDAFLRVRERWSNASQLLERLVVDAGPRAVELVPHRRGHRALRGDLRLDRTLLAGGQVSTPTSPSPICGSLIGQLACGGLASVARRLAADQGFYFANAYAVEFLKGNLAQGAPGVVRRRAGACRAAPSESGAAGAAARRPRAGRPGALHGARREGAVGRSRRRAPPGRTSSPAGPQAPRTAGRRRRCARRSKPALRRRLPDRLRRRPVPFLSPGVPGADAGDLEGQVLEDAAARRGDCAPPPAHGSITSSTTAIRPTSRSRSMSATSIASARWPWSPAA